MKNTQLTEKQIESIDCLVASKIVDCKINLLSSPKYYMGELTHLRDIRRTLNAMDREVRMRQAVKEWDENRELYNMFVK